MPLRQRQRALRVEAWHDHLGDARDQPAVEQHHHAVDVIEGQDVERDIGLLHDAGAERLTDVRRQVLVTEHDALRQAGRAAGVRQHGDVLHGIDGDGRRVALRGARHLPRLLQLIHAHELRQLLLRFIDDGHQRAEREDGLRAGVAELMLDLALAIERVQRRDGGAGEQRAVQRDGVLGRVRRVDGYHVALADAVVLQRARHAAHGRPQFGEGVRRAIGGDQRRLAGQPPDGRLDHLGHAHRLIRGQAGPGALVRHVRASASTFGRASTLSESSLAVYPPVGVVDVPRFCFQCVFCDVVLS